MKTLLFSAALLLCLPLLTVAQKISFPQSFELGHSYFPNMQLLKLSREEQEEIGLKESKGLVTDETTILRLAPDYEGAPVSAVTAIYYELYQNPARTHEDGGLFVYQYQDKAMLQFLIQDGAYQQPNEMLLYTDRYLISVWLDLLKTPDAAFEKIFTHLQRTTGAKRIPQKEAPVGIVELAMPTAEGDETHYDLGFGEVPAKLLTPESREKLQDMIRQLEASFGTQTAFQALPAGQSPAALDQETIDGMLYSHTNRQRNHVQVFFQPETGQSRLFFGGVNEAFLSKYKKSWEQDFQKNLKADGLAHAATTLLQQVNGVYQKLPSAKIEFLKLDAAAIESIAYNHMEREEYEEAIAGYREFIAAFPQSSRGYYNLAWIYNTTGRQQEAIKVAKEALKQVAQYQKWKFHRTIGSSYTDLKQYPEGQKYLKLALEAQPEDPLALYNLGYNYFMSHSYEEAIATLEHALEYRDEDGFNLYDTYFYIGTSLQGLGRYEEALVWLDQAIDGSQYESYFFNKAQTLINLERYADAIATATEGLKHTPNSGDLYFKRAQAYRHKKDLLRAQQDLEKAHQLNPDDPSIMLDMGGVYTDRNEIKKALAIYHRLLKQQPEEAGKVYSNMAGIFATNPETRDSALVYYQKAIKTDPQNFTFYYNLGNLYREEGKYSEAIAKYRKALTLKQDEPRIYTNLASTYKLMDDYPAAKAALQQGLAVIPNDYAMNALMADLVYLQDKDYTAATQHATTALTAMPNGEHTLQLLTIRGNARQMQGAFSEALYDYLDIYKKLSPSDTDGRATVLSNIGYCYLELKDWKNGEKYFDQSLKLQQDVDPMIGKLLLYHQSGNAKKLTDAKAAVIRQDARLKEGISGIEALEADGYFYTPAQKELLAQIFRN